MPSSRIEKISLSSATLKAASSAVEITYCGQETLRHHSISECEIRRKLEARLILFKDESGKEVLWIGADECEIHRLKTAEIKRVLKERANLSTGQIWLAATHTHAAHSFQGLDGIAFGNVVADALPSLRENLRPVKKIVQRLGTVPKGFIINRRLFLSEALGEICVMFNFDCAVDLEKAELDATGQVIKFLESLKTTPEKEGIPNQGWILKGPTDNRVFLWTLEDDAGKTIAAVARVNAHPVTVSQSRVGKVVSGDYVGFMADRLKESLGVSCLILNGSFGNARPLQKEYTFSESERIGKTLAEITLSGTLEEFDVSPLKGVSIPAAVIPRRLDMPGDLEELKKLREKLQNEPDPTNAPDLKPKKELLERIAFGLYPSPPGGASPLLEEERRTNKMKLEFQAWTLGPMKIVALPGEPFLQVSQAIEKKTGGFLTAGVCNGDIWYFPDEASWKRGGYESCASNLDPAGIKKMIKTAVETAKQLAEKDA